MPDGGWTTPRPYDWGQMIPVLNDDLLIPRIDPPFPRKTRSLAVGEIARIFELDSDDFPEEVLEARRLLQEVLDGEIRRRIEETNQRLIARMSHPAYGPNRRPAM